jgi:hypothetical protein
LTSGSDTSASWCSSFGGQMSIGNRTELSW